MGHGDCILSSFSFRCITLTLRRKRNTSLDHPRLALQEYKHDLTTYNASLLALGNGSRPSLQSETLWELFLQALDQRWNVGLLRQICTVVYPGWALIPLFGKGTQ